VWIAALLEMVRAPSLEMMRPFFAAAERGEDNLNAIDRLREGCRESRRFSRDTYPESYITK